MALSIDVRVLNPFLTAALECVTVMGDLKPERKRLFVKTTPIMHGEFAGVIGLSKGVTGSCVVSFPDTLARRIVGRLMSEDPDALSRDLVQDGIGEVANMVAGGARRILSGSVLQFDISTPTILYGRPIQLYNPPDTIAIACEFAVHPEWPETFMVELATRPTQTG